ncbi:MAG: hypothetical protein GWO07_13615 [Candidatus Dadabacteria bacterium]|nr:hypothetical protein [Candidatus Dadabacteria bacterium]NIS09764.1 hypothetical protein [Candidatus Dadabacteria bacterium]NIY22532.1 hypothetical protein [Candidatus Dadabacteria bacterium]
MVVGVSIVYVFLILLMISIIISSKFFRTARQNAQGRQTPQKQDTNDLIAVISKAIEVYRSKKQK